MVGDPCIITALILCLYRLILCLYRLVSSLIVMTKPRDPRFTTGSTVKWEMIVALAFPMKAGKCGCEAILEATTGHQGIMYS